MRIHVVNLNMGMMKGEKVQVAKLRGNEIEGLLQYLNAGPGAFHIVEPVTAAWCLLVRTHACGVHTSSGV